MLKKVSIKNFRSCVDTEFELKGNVCALVGKNGAGKTTVLKAVELLASSATGLTPVSWEYSEYDVSIEFRFDLDGVSFWYSLTDAKVDSGGLVPASRLKESLKARPAAGELVEIIRRDGESVTLHGSSNSVRIAAYTPSLAALLSILPDSDRNRGFISKASHFLKNVRYYAFEDRQDAEFLDKAILIDEHIYIKWATNSGERPPTSSVALRLLYMWKNDRPLFDEFKAIVGPNGINAIKDCRVGPIDVRSLFGNNDIYYSVEFNPAENMGGSSQSLLFSSLSAGTQRIIRIILSLLFDERSVMLIEQPEDSIHTEMLRKLLGTLRSYSDRTQILFTTHSTEVLDVLKPEEVLLTTARNGETKVRSLSPPEKKRAKRFLAEVGTLSEFFEVLDD